MRILMLTHAFNSLSQRLFAELRWQGQDVSVEFDINDAVTMEAVALFRPDLILSPFLKRAIPEVIWRHHVCLVVHPASKVTAGRLRWTGRSSTEKKTGGDGVAGQCGDGCGRHLGHRRISDEAGRQG